MYSVDTRTIHSVQHTHTHYTSSHITCTINANMANEIVKLKKNNNNNNKEKRESQKPHTRTAYIASTESFVCCTDETKKKLFWFFFLLLFFFEFFYAVAFRSVTLHSLTKLSRIELDLIIIIMKNTIIFLSFRLCAVTTENTTHNTLNTTRFYFLLFSVEKWRGDKLRFGYSRIHTEADTHTYESKYSVSFSLDLGVYDWRCTLALLSGHNYMHKHASGRNTCIKSTVQYVPAPKTMPHSALVVFRVPGVSCAISMCACLWVCALCAVSVYVFVLVSVDMNSRHISTAATICWRVFQQMEREQANANDGEQRARYVGDNEKETCYVPASNEAPKMPVSEREKRIEQTRIRSMRCDDNASMKRRNGKPNKIDCGHVFHSHYL